MKEITADESLSEEARDSAKKALEVLVSSQLLAIEQTAALKKLESEAMAEAKKVEVEALAKGKTAEATSLLALAKGKAAEAALMLQAAEIKEKRVEATLSEEMAEWLGRHRLNSCATDVARIAGA